MSPFFNPGPIEHPEIPIYIAGVNQHLAKLAGELADGFQVHPLHSQKYLQEFLLPAILDGASQAGRSRTDIQIAANVFVATSDEDLNNLRATIAFYASTPSYRAVMKMHGWQALAEQLSALAARQKWTEMPGLITDEMVETLAVVTNPVELASALKRRYDALADRLTLYLPFVPGQNDPFWQDLIGAFQSHGR